MAALHNVRVLKQGVCALALTALVGAGLAGCSDDDTGPSLADAASASASAAASGGAGESGASGASGSTSASAAPHLPVPEGVELTTQGSQLAVGESATVAYQPNQQEVGVLDIKVTRIEKTSFKKSFVGWNLTDEQKSANPYFVRATVTNRGTTDLGGRRVPLYIVDGTNALVESTSFASAFTPCEPGSFPEKYPPGKKTKVCMVYLSPDAGDLTAVSFRPAQEYDPITWTGTLESPKKPKKSQGDS